jgi:hypothetical protein
MRAYFVEGRLQAGRDRAAATLRAQRTSGAARKEAPSVRRERDVSADEGQGLNRIGRRTVIWGIAAQALHLLLHGPTGRQSRRKGRRVNEGVSSSHLRIGNRAAPSLIKPMIRYALLFGYPAGSIGSKQKPASYQDSNRWRLVGDYKHGIFTECVLVFYFSVGLYRLTKRVGICASSYWSSYPARCLSAAYT